MAETGKNQVISFGGTIYACLTSGSSDGSSSPVKTECSSDGTGSAVTHQSTGSPEWNSSYSIVIPGASAVVPAALNINTAGAFLHYPHGDASGDIEYKWIEADSEVSGHTIAATPSTHMVLDISFLHTGAATIGTKT